MQFRCRTAYRLITSLLDAEKFTAQLLACKYHQGWEVENTIDELKVHLLGRKTHIRSQRPKEVVQEIYGSLLGHLAVRSLIFQVASNASFSPLRLSFTETLRVVRRALPKFQWLQPQELPFFWVGWLGRFSIKIYRKESRETTQKSWKNLSQNFGLNKLNTEVLES